MTASRSVSIQQVPSPAPVAVAMKPSTAERAVSVSFTISLMCLLQRVILHMIFVFLAVQILMNVQLGLMAATRSAPTLQDHSSVPAPTVVLNSLLMA